MGNQYGNHESGLIKQISQNKLINENKVDPSNYSSVERSRPTNDEQAIMKQSLKVLYKNNFVSLTFEDMHAFIIQTYWRHHLVKKLKKKRRGMIDVIYSSIGYKSNSASKTEGVLIRMDAMKYPYRCYDLMVYKNLVKVVDKFGGKDQLPMVFINNYYIGGADDFQQLEDRKLISSLVNKDYEKRCLACNIFISSKDCTTCPYCYTNYVNFAKNVNQIDIFACRKEEKTRKSKEKFVIKKK